jgi:hypothetical protein
VRGDSSALVPSSESVLAVITPVVEQQPHDDDVPSAAIEAEIRLRSSVTR